MFREKCNLGSEFAETSFGCFSANFTANGVSFALILLNAAIAVEVNMRRVAFRKFIQMNRLQSMNVMIRALLPKWTGFPPQPYGSSSFATAAGRGAFGTTTGTARTVHSPGIIALRAHTAICIIIVDIRSHLLLQ